MVSCVGIGTVTGSIFLIVLLFVAGNMEQVTTSAAGPLLQILLDATKSNAGAICLLMYVTKNFESFAFFWFTNSNISSQAATCLLGFRYHQRYDY